MKIRQLHLFSLVLMLSLLFSISSYASDVEVHYGVSDEELQGMSNGSNADFDSEVLYDILLDNKDLIDSALLQCCDFDSDAISLSTGDYIPCCLKSSLNWINDSTIFFVDIEPDFGGTYIGTIYFVFNEFGTCITDIVVSLL